MEPLIDLSDLQSFIFVMHLCLQIRSQNAGEKIFGIAGSLVKSRLSVVIYADLTLFSLTNSLFNEWIQTTA